MDLSPTAYVILGMLGSQPRSGYEIKQLVDRSTRFFWAASYGQIYPELRRLAAEGLIEGTEAPTGGRRRTVYRLTSAGRRELRAWLRSPPETHEVRDEALLKLFFSGSAPDAAAQAIEGKRRVAAEKLATLREIEPVAAEQATPYQYMTLRHGIAVSEFTIRWCDEALAELRKRATKTARGRRAA